MKYTPKYIIYALALFCAITTAMAQPQAGDWEFTLGGGGASDTDFDNGGIGLNGSFGYFYNSNLEVALRQSLNFVNAGADEEWSGSTRIAADYHFLFDRIVPFVGANFGIDYNEDDSVWGIGPEAGIKYFVHERTFLFAMAEYRWLFDDFDQADDNADDGRFAFTFGVGFNIGGR